MGAFTLDTSGEVFWPGPEGHSLDWSDLDPFTQGYVEALFASAHEALQTERRRRFDRFMHSEVATCPDGERFSDLDPETLAAILKDCADNTHEFLQPRGFSEVSRNNGRHFWALRQAGFWPAKWPQLTPSLSDDGKVYLRATPSTSHPLGDREAAGPSSAMGGSGIGHVNNSAETEHVPPTCKGSGQ